MPYTRGGGVRTPVSSTGGNVPLNSATTALASTTGTSIGTSNGQIAINALTDNMHISFIPSDASAILYLKFNATPGASAASSSNYDAFLTYANPYLQLGIPTGYAEVDYKLSVGTMTLLQTQSAG